jgi:hypothetical protein
MVMIVLKQVTDFCLDIGLIYSLIIPITCLYFILLIVSNIQILKKIYCSEMLQFTVRCRTALFEPGACGIFIFWRIAKTPSRNVENFLVVESGRKW